MAEEVLSDALLNALSKKIDIALYPASDFAVDLGFDFAAASAAEQHSFQTLNPQGKYEHLLKKFVDTHGRGAKDLIDIFKDKQKKDLVNFLEEGLSVVVALLAIVVACNWNNIFPEPGKCASSPCQNGGTCHERRGEYSCKCKTGYEGSNCEIEYIAENFSLEECQDTLRRHYENHLFNIHINPWDSDEYVDLETLYTTVSLYKEDKNNIPDKPLHKSTLEGSVNDIFQTKVHGSLPERIVLFGEAGRGKTTAVAKMAYDWANKKEDSPLKNVKLLFVFKMRNMNAKTGITEAIVPLLGKKYKKYQKQLEDYINSHEKDIVMLFDGYDEFSGMLHCRENAGDVVDILCQQSCRRCRVLVTSRPVRSVWIQLFKDFYMRYFNYSKMVIEGYSQQHATDFIDKFFVSNEIKGTELKNYLKEDIVANEMIATPLYCTMVCYLWNEGFIHGKFTRTKLFDDIMEFLRTHLNRKNERDREIKQDLLDDTVVSVGQVAFTKLSDKYDLNPLLLSENDFSEVHDDKVNISYALGLLTKNMKTDSDIIIYIEFFHKLAQEYSAGRYLASGLDEERVSTIGFSEVLFDLKEIFQFASGTSVWACRQILASLVDQGSRLSFSNRDYHPIILDFISEAGTCAGDSERNLKYLFKDGNLQLRQVTASTVVGFEKLPQSVKKKITTIDILGTTTHPDLFVKLWNSMDTCIHLTHMEIYQTVPPTISPQMEPLYSVNSLTTVLLAPVDDYVQIMAFLPNIRELIISSDESGDLSEFAFTPDIFGRLWDQLNSSSLISRLVLPIPPDIGFNLKHLTSIRVFETYNVISVSSLAHVLTFLPKVRQLIIQEKELVKMKYSNDAFCKLWKILHTSPDLNRLFLPIPAYRDIPCDLEPLRSVQILETKSFSILLPIVLTNLPNLQKLLIQSDIPGYQEVNIKSAHKLFDRFWSVLHSLRELRHLGMNVPESVPASLLDPLRSVQTFQTKIESHMDVFSILLSRLPNISELVILATNTYNRKIAEDTYYDKVVLAITDGLVKNGVQLEVLNMTFDPRREPRKTVSRDTVENFIQMLKKSGMMRKLEIISFNYCVFNESDLLEMITAIREFTSIWLLR
eukprot:XP_011664686.1 PREDICTED: uncharacterized protein LOC105438493 [Strongylocentrotus purpuratus]